MKKFSVMRFGGGPDTMTAQFNSVSFLIISPPTLLPSLLIRLQTGAYDKLFISSLGRSRYFCATHHKKIHLINNATLLTFDFRHIYTQFRCFASGWLFISHMFRYKRIGKSASSRGLDSLNYPYTLSSMA